MKLEAKDISVTIRGRPIVSKAYFTLEKGELVGLIGPNGAGKSTLLKAMLGVTPMSDGEVFLNGKNLRHMPTRERARQIAFLPQERRVEWRLQAHDVVSLGRYPHRAGFGGPTPEDSAAVERALTAVDGAALSDRPVQVLSGGEKTRILLARALAVEAPILMVDEPITALDPFHQIHVMEILKNRAHSGVGVLAVIHDLSLAARFMDRLILMDEGRVVASGHPDNILASDKLEAAYGIDVLRGTHEGRSWVLPWSRTQSEISHDA